MGREGRAAEQSDMWQYSCRKRVNGKEADKRNGNEKQAARYDANKRGKGASFLRKVDWQNAPSLISKKENGPCILVQAVLPFPNLHESKNPSSPIASKEENTHVLVSESASTFRQLRSSMESPIVPPFEDAKRKLSKDWSRRMEKEGHGNGKRLKEKKESSAREKRAKWDDVCVGAVAALDTDVRQDNPVRLKRHLLKGA